MERKMRWIAGGAAAGVALAVAGVGVAAASDGDGGDGDDTPITGEALDEASAAALEETGGGEVTETESGDEESAYEVEVTLDDGRQVDVQLDESFAVVSSSADDTDGRGDDDGRRDDDGDDAALTGATLDKASAAALEETGGGQVTDTETSDDHGAAYEVEVTLDGGSQVDVHLDDSFAVVSSSADDAGEIDD